MVIYGCRPLLEFIYRNTCLTVTKHTTGRELISDWSVNSYKWLPMKKKTVVPWIKYSMQSTTRNVPLENHYKTICWPVRSKYSSCRVQKQSWIVAYEKKNSVELWTENSDWTLKSKCSYTIVVKLFTNKSEVSALPAAVQRQWVEVQPDLTDLLIAKNSHVRVG